MHNSLRPWALAIQALTLVATAQAQAPQCEFHDLAQDVVETFGVVDVTDNQKAWESGVANAMPYAKRIYGAADPPFVLLQGWYESATDLTQFSREGAAAVLREAVGKKKKEGETVRASVETSDPISLYVWKELEVDGKPFRDLRVVIVALPTCFVAFEIGASDGVFGESEWSTVEAGVATMREKVLAKIGPLTFAKPSVGATAIRKAGGGGVSVVGLVSAVVGLFGIIVAVSLGRLAKSRVAGGLMQIGGVIVAIVVMSAIAGDASGKAGEYLAYLGLAAAAAWVIVRRFFRKKTGATV